MRRRQLKNRSTQSTRRLATAVLVALACAYASPSTADDLQIAFMKAMRQIEAGDLIAAEGTLRAMLEETDSPRVQLELARTLYMEGRYTEAKTLFLDIAARPDTPWRVRDNIALFIDQIEEKTGYLKFGVTFVSDTNPRNLSGQKEFSIAGLKVTPTDAPKKIYGLRYAARGWLPIAESAGIGAYAAAAYVDFPNSDFDRLTVDAGLTKSLLASGNLGAKVGVEAATLGGRVVYSMPYVGLQSSMAIGERNRLATELKFGRLHLPDFSYQDATFSSAAISLRHGFAPQASAVLRTSVERSNASERPYSYWGWEVGPGLNWLWPQTAFYVGTSASFARRSYGDVDPVFGDVRSDSRTRLEVSLGNKTWRWRRSNVVVTASLEENHSSIEFFSYHKANLSISIE